MTFSFLVFYSIQFEQRLYSGQCFATFDSCIQVLFINSIGYYIRSLLVQLTRLSTIWGWFLIFCTSFSLTSSCAALEFMTLTLYDKS